MGVETNAVIPISVVASIVILRRLSEGSRQQMITALTREVKVVKSVRIGVILFY